MKNISTKKQISILLVDAIIEQNLYLDEPVDLSTGDDAILYGDNGNLDSLSLITIIADIEKKIENDFSIKVKLANEKDLKILDSPFTTLGKMVSFIMEKINETKITN